MNFRYFKIADESGKPGPIFYRNLFAEFEAHRLNPIVSLIISFEQDSDPNFDAFWKSTSVLQAVLGHAHVIRLWQKRDEVQIQKFNNLYGVEQIPSIYIFGPESIEPALIISHFPSISDFVSQFSEISAITTSSLTAIPVLEGPPQDTNPSPSLSSSSSSLSSTNESKTSENNSTNQEFSSEPIHRSPKNQPSTNNNNNNINNNNSQNINIKPETPKTVPKKSSQIKTSESNGQKSYSNKPSSFAIVSVGVETPSGKTILRGFDESDNVSMVREWIFSIVPPEEMKNKEIVFSQTEEVFPSDSHICLETYRPRLTLKIIPKKILPTFHLPHFQLPSFLGFLRDLSPFGTDDDNPYEFWAVQNVNPPQQNPNQGPNNNQRGFLRRDGNLHFINNRRDDDDNRPPRYNNGNNQQFEQ